MDRNDLFVLATIKFNKNDKRCLLQCYRVVERCAQMIFHSGSGDVQRSIDSVDIICILNDWFRRSNVLIIFSDNHTVTTNVKPRWLGSGISRQIEPTNVECESCVHQSTADNAYWLTLPPFVAGNRQRFRMNSNPATNLKSISNRIVNAGCSQ